MLQRFPSHNGFVQMLDGDSTTVSKGAAPWNTCITSYNDPDNDKFIYQIIIKRCQVGVDTVGYTFEISHVNIVTAEGVNQKDKLCCTVTIEEIQEVQKGYPKDVDSFEMLFRCESHELLVDIYPEYPIVCVFAKRL